jgi:FlaA1/EpsC-like NDP-sugar epimerase
MTVRLPSRHRLWQVAADAGLVALAWYLSFQIRFDQGVYPPYNEFLGLDIFLVVTAVYVLVFLVFGLYEHWWRYVSIRDVWRTILAVSVAALCTATALYFWDPLNGSRLPRGIVVIDWILVLAFVTGARLLVRTLVERPGGKRLVSRGKETLVVGAGDAGQLVVREMLRSPRLRYTPIGLVDDDPRKKNMRLHGVRVLGTTRDLPRLLAENRPDEVIIAIPPRPGRCGRPS